MTRAYIDRTVSPARADSLMRPVAETDSRLKHCQLRFAHGAHMVDGATGICTYDGRSTKDLDFHSQVYGSDKECVNLYVPYVASINPAGEIRVVIMD